MNNPKRSKCSLFSLYALCAALAFSSCIKPLEDMGFYESTICEGTLINDQNNKPIAGMRVSLTNGDVVSAVVESAADGTFSINVAPTDIHHQYYLQVDADSLYQSRQVAIDNVPFGHQQFNLGVIQVQGPVVPTVQTANIEAIAGNTAASGGTVTDVGGSAVVRRGVCWSVLQLPTIDDPHTTDGRGPGEFTSQMTGLSLNTVYYVRAYATNSIGTAYGEQIEFRTADGLPTLTTAEVTDITASTATAGGDVLTDAGYVVRERGVCWSITQQPTIVNNHTSDSIGLGPFVSQLTGLEPGTTYYVRAYATNGAGTAYGQQCVFTTESGLCTVLTTAPNTASITSTAATLGGNVTSDGGFDCLTRGVCYGTAPAPTIANAHTTDGLGTGTFVSHLSNLQPATTYYVRAYATNGIGTSYGEEVVFSTK